MKICWDNLEDLIYNKKTGRWCAQIQKNGKHYILGKFDSITNAAIAYNNAATKLYGEFAYINEVNYGMDN